MKRKVITILSGFFLLSSTASISMARDSTDINPWEKEARKPFLKSILEDQAYIYSAPFRMKGKDWLVCSGVLLITGLLIAHDESIYQGIKEFQRRNSWVDKVSPVITDLGLGEWNLAIAGSFFMGGTLFKNERARETARLTLMTLVHTGVVVQIGKHIFGRQRPSWDDGQDAWAGPSGFFRRYESGQMSHYDAFPSGHTITVFGTATVISEMYRDTLWVPILCYSAASLCGLSRVTEDTHWLSDVFLGAILGHVIGKMVVKRRNRMRYLNITPVVSSRMVGLSLGVQF